jgi:membrane-bound lytic murein transglycosylase F
MFLKYRNILAMVIMMFALSIIVEQTRSASVWNDGRFEAPLRDLDGILKEGKLRVVVDYNFTNYFVYRGKPMGYKYEMLKQLARELDVKLEFVVSNDLEETFRGLETGRFDLAAKNLTITQERNKRVDFTQPITQTRQVLVQRRQSNKSNSRNQLVNSQLELAGKTITVQKHTAFVTRLHNIEEEIGYELVVVEDSLAGVEQLVSMVASGEIDYTVCDEIVAKLYARHYSNLDVSVPVSFRQNIAWAVRKDAAKLKEYLDIWLDDFQGTDQYKQLQVKYFSADRSVRRSKNIYHSFTKGLISPFDELIKREAASKNWDWRLIASIIYQESQFDTAASSWAGASGLMQLMPETALAFGVEDATNPEQNIRGGIKLLSWLDSQLKSEISEPEERLKFVLAAYNVGLGHVKDAQRLAHKYGKDPFRWSNNVDFFLLNKSMAKYYSDPVVKWGYARGSEPYQFVASVLNNYGHYKNVIPE